MTSTRKASDILLPYLLLTYLAVLVNACGYLREVKYLGWITPLFVGATYLFYVALYLLPVVVLLWLVSRLIALRVINRTLEKVRLSRPLVLCLVAAITTALLQVVLYADKLIFHMYGFHLNGFVWNLVFTRGGLESLGGDTSTTVSFGLIIFGLAAVQAAMLLLVWYSGYSRRAFAVLLNRRALIAGLVGLAVLGVFGQATYGMSSVRGYTPVLAASNVFPLYAPITFNTLAKKLGWEVRRAPKLDVDLSSIRMAYPAQPIRQQRPAKPFNIILLVGESLRWDMLTPKTMPATWALAQKSLWCRHHYSGANGTRMAMFSMFYGLYGTNWFQFLAERRGPVLVDVLLDQGYQMELYTSAGFSYPEFDHTIFVAVDRKQMHERVCLPQWRCDRQQISAMLESIDRRDPARPFMTFMFFESPHANYHFPPECVVAEPYAEGLNYATMDLEKDIGLIKNRYINACNHLDTQVQRVVEYLEQHDLMDSTILLVTGDHGEEFMEKGRWGHNSSFSEQQTLVPFVLWVPGMQPRQLTRMTSHLDLPATIMPLLGVANPPADYSSGYDLYGEAARPFTILSDWNHVAFVDDQYKVSFSIKSYGFAPPTVTTIDDAEVPDPDALFGQYRTRLVQVMRNLRMASGRR